VQGRENKCMLELSWIRSVLKRVKLTIDGQDTWGEDYTLRSNYIDGSARRIQAATRLIVERCNPFQSFLEIGVSPGVGAAPIVALNPGLSLAAIDGRSNMTPSPAERLQADYEVGGISIAVNCWRVNAELDRFPIENDRFDVISCCDVLEHLLLDPYHLVLEVNRILRPGGYFLLETSPSQAYWTHKVKLLVGPSIEEPYSGYGAYGRRNRLFLVSEVCELVKAAGFEIVHASTLACYAGLFGDITRRFLTILKPLNMVCDYLGSHIFSARQ
jgi:SAM-dependent methyltransferase